ncbi:unnamed protein product [Didymodactylos carnosus]|uniref:Putative restriction endonuclease domain-containing protein n=1 Tax=Didymodactylos carnosus TaxID=1234261 RepID=A0A813TJE2_9BILA|nr:unnamed protein product [Didymodactylos carnosus]CAF3600702.1 unnamed protein product [Didymodactylos carnosus]
MDDSSVIEISEKYQGCKVEVSDKIAIMRRDDSASAINSSIYYHLYKWWLDNGKPGKVRGPDAGIDFGYNENGERIIYSPDSFWVAPSQIQNYVPDVAFQQWLPAFVIEVGSPGQTLQQQRKKMEFCLGGLLSRQQPLVIPF